EKVLVLKDHPRAGLPFVRDNIAIYASAMLLLVPTRAVQVFLNRQRNNRHTEQLGMRMLERSPRFLAVIVDNQDVLDRWISRVRLITIDPGSNDFGDLGNRHLRQV